MPDTAHPGTHAAQAGPAQAAQDATNYAPDYATARQWFRQATALAGAVAESQTHPQRGPDGGELAIDLAWLGPRDARRVLVLISGTHGVEGYQGSAAQIGFLQQTGSALPADTAALLIHGLNPHGFAWVRRVNEDNIDINRNYLDFSRPLPANPGYAEVHAMILPEALTPAALGQVQQQLLAYMARVGKAAAATAITGGQYTHPDGIFYGGQRLCWSNRQLADIAGQYLQLARVICVVDHHTGLGPVGHTELICRHAAGSRELALARAWLGDDVTSPAQGESASAVIDGNVRMAFGNLCPQAQVVAVCAEVGTAPETQVLAALLADNWLHQRGVPLSALGDGVRRQLMAAFCPPDAGWRTQAFERAMALHRSALAGLRTAHAAPLGPAFSPHWPGPRP
jgi:hypothetical protein